MAKTQPTDNEEADKTPRKPRVPKAPVTLIETKSAIKTLSSRIKVIEDRHAKDKLPELRANLKSLQQQYEHLLEAELQTVQGASIAVPS